LVIRVVSGCGCGGCGLSRRAILKGGAAGALLAAAPAACVSQPSVPSGPIAAGNVSGVPAGTLEVLGDVAVVLGRDDSGLYAMSAVCTHAGCVVGVVSDATGAKSLRCGCHGSTFDRDGAVTMGPAMAALRHFEVDVAADGTITIRGDVAVAADARTSVS
jgi:Rieske Fe-S protein